MSVSRVEEAGVAPSGSGVAAAGLGGRVRALRVALGLSQSELAGGRFSKEYVSQVERGRTRPTAATLEWLAGRLGTDAEFLEGGIGAAERERLLAGLVAAEELAERHEYERALDLFTSIGEQTAQAGSPELVSRSLRGQAWASMQLGDLARAGMLLEQPVAQIVAAEPATSEHAELVFLCGVLAYKRSAIDEALRLFGGALDRVERAEVASDRLRSDILGWRSRCYRRLRDWEAAREDIEAAIELADGLADARRAAQAYFQSSLVWERMGNWVRARRDAERALTLFEALGDRPNTGRMLNNLGGLSHLLGDSARAVELLERSFAIAVDTGSTPDAGHVLCSLAEVHLANDRVEAAEQNARKALALFDDRADYRHEIGIAQLTLGRALLEQGQAEEAGALIDAAWSTFEQIDSVGHQAAASLAQGDLAASRGHTLRAAALYRQAAQALQPDTLLLL